MAEFSFLGEFSFYLQFIRITEINLSKSLISGLLKEWKELHILKHKKELSKN